MSRDQPTPSAFRRFARLGGLAGRVGASMLGEQLLDLARSGPTRELRQSQALVRNAARVVETLGELKGAAMKVGQMLSLHQGLLPPEVAGVLSALQKEAPKVPFEVMEYEIRGQLENFDELFASLEPEAFAAASIGQVHRATLRDGRPVAVKIQYPLIEEIIRADLQNLRTVLHRLFALFSRIEFDPVWEEVRDRLLEEVDYLQEAENMRRMAALHADVPEIVIPGVVSEATSRRVLTTDYLVGIPADEACSESYGQQVRDRWGRVLFEFQLRGLFRHRLLHADPNLANFSFIEDGRVIVYDFGCVKRIPQRLAEGYAELVLAVLDGRRREIPRILKRLGVFKEGGRPLPAEVVEPYVDLFAEIFRDDPPYTFGEDPELYDKLLDLGMANLDQARDLRFPRDVVFIDRSLGGHFGNLARLRASGPWRELALGHARRAERGG